MCGTVFVKNLPWSPSRQNLGTDLGGRGGLGFSLTTQGHQQLQIHNHNHNHNTNNHTTRSIIPMVQDQCPEQHTRLLLRRRHRRQPYGHVVVPRVVLDVTACHMLLVVLLFLFSCDYCHAQQRQDPTKLNGGSILAMAGKDCIAVAVDKRFGSGMQVSSAFLSSQGSVALDDKNNPPATNHNAVRIHKDNQRIGLWCGNGFVDLVQGCVRALSCLTKEE